MPANFHLTVLLFYRLTYGMHVRSWCSRRTTIKYSDDDNDDDDVDDDECDIS